MVRCTLDRHIHKDSGELGLLFVDSVFNRRLVQTKWRFQLIFKLNLINPTTTTKYYIYQNTATLANQRH